MSENIFILSDGEKVPVIIENRRGARNVTLRPKTSPKFEIHISKPWTTSTNFVMKFLESKRKWIEHIFDSAPTKEEIKATSPAVQRYGVARSGMVPGAFTHDNTENPSNNNFINLEFFPTGHKKSRLHKGNGL